MRYRLTYDARAEDGYGSSRRHHPGSSPDPGRTAVQYFRSNPRMRWLIPVIDGMFALTFVGQAITPGKGGVGLSVVSAGLALVVGVFAVRGARSATVVARRDGIVCRGWWRSWRWSWDQIAAFEARDWTVPGHEGAVLLLHDTQGTEHRLPGMYLPRRYGPAALRRSADELNELVTRYRP